MGRLGHEDEVFVVELTQFSGPLDLLLSLIRDEQIDIYDIPVARIAEQFLARISSLALDEAGVTKGAINLVTGPGSKVGNELVTNPDVKAQLAASRDKFAMPPMKSPAPLHSRSSRPILM